MAKKKNTKEYTLVGVGAPSHDFYGGIPVSFLSHKTGQQFTLDVSGLDFEYDVTFPDDKEPDLNLAQEAVDAISDIVEKWSHMTTMFITKSIATQRIQRRQQKTLTIAS
jgi:hypothetical protein